MGNKAATQKLVLGFVKEFEDKHEIDSNWKVSQSELVIFLIASFAHKDIEDLQLKTVLSVGREEKISQPGDISKGAVDNDHNLLALVTGSSGFDVVDMAKKETIFQLATNCGNSQHALHWMLIDAQQYILIQTSHNAVKGFKVVSNSDSGSSSFQFIEDEKFHLTVDGKINFCEVDEQFVHVVLVVDSKLIQIRAINDLQKVKKTVALDEMYTISNDYRRSLQISADGRHCVLGAGINNEFFYLIDIEKGTQRRIVSNYLGDSYAPCFINGESHYVAIGDYSGRIEIWDIERNISHRKLHHSRIQSSLSKRNILAIGSIDKKLTLIDVRNWKPFYTKQFNFDGDSLHVTRDLRYLTFGGSGGDKCVVLSVE